MRNSHFSARSSASCGNDQKLIDRVTRAFPQSFCSVFTRRRNSTQNVVEYLHNEERAAVPCWVAARHARSPYLRTLLAGPTDGHAVAKHIQRTSENLLQVETGSLYPALHRRRRKAGSPPPGNCPFKGKRAK